MAKRRIVVVVLILFVLMAGGLVLTQRSPVEKGIREKEKIFLLLLTLEKKEEPKSLKNILLVNYQPESKRLALVAIPPQTLISDKRKLKSLYYQNLQRHGLQGGCLALKDAIEKFLDLKIPFYLVFDEEDFITIINLLGGIEIKVDLPPTVELPWWGGERLSGARHQTVLSGEESLAYLEFEEPRFGEFGKFARWQKFVWALIQRCNDSPPTPKLVGEFFKRFLLTNLRANDILVLVQEAENIREAGIAVEKIPGRRIYRDWMSYWQVDIAATARLFRRLDKRLEEEEEIIRVEVLNGCGKDGIAFQLAQDLRRKGLDVVNIGNARNFKYQKTLILNRSGKKGVAKKVAEMAGGGHPQDEIEKNALVDVTIIIGRDYLKGG